MFPKVVERVDRVSNYALVVILMATCWLGTEKFSGIIINAPISASGHHLTVSGLMSLCFILLTSFFLLHLSSRQLVNCVGEPTLSRRKLFLGIIGIYFLYIICNIRRVDSDYYVAVENYFFLLLFFAVTGSVFFSSSFGLFRKWAPPLFGLSYFLALFLPLVFDSRSDVIFGFFDLILRYKGWLGTPVAIGFLGLSVILSSLFQLQAAKKFRVQAFYISLILSGISGIYLSVHRISMLAAATVFIFFVFKNFRFQKWTLAGCNFVFLIIAMGSMVTGTMGSKSGLQVGKAIESKNINYAVQTNGRYDVIIRIWEATSGHRFFGLGTGGTSRFISDHKMGFGKQPHNDYLRIFGDQGFFGLFIFFVIITMICWNLQNSFALASYLAFLVCLLTDNILILPIFGLAPLFLVALTAENPKPVFKRKDTVVYLER